jgi:hypothetical protein
MKELSIECYYEEGLGPFIDEIESGLADDWRKWITDSATIASQFFENSPQYNFTWNMVTTYFDFHTDRLHSLRLALFDKGKPIPRECIIWVGSHDYIEYRKYQTAHQRRTRAE